MAEIRIKCPYCDVLLDVPQDMSGEHIECPDCDEVFEVPASTPKRSGGKKKLSMAGRRKRLSVNKKSGPASGDEDGAPRNRPVSSGKSPFPTTLGAIYFLFGLIATVILPALFILLYVSFRDENPNWTDQQSLVALLLLAIAVIVPLMIGAVYFICGFGLIKRKTWAYKLNILITLIGTFHMMPFALFGYMFLMPEFKREFNTF